MARTHVLRGTGAGEPVAGIEALRGRVSVGDPQQHLAVAVRPRPIQKSLHQQVADPRRRNRGSTHIAVIAAAPLASPSPPLTVPATTPSSSATKRVLSR